MGRKIIYIIRVILSVLIVASMLISWFWYLLAFSNIPVIYTEQLNQDLKIILCSFLIAFLALLLEIVINEKNKFKGSYLVVVAGGILLLLWIIRYNNGFNYNTREEIINICEKKIVIIGMFFSVLSVVTQFFQITRQLSRGGRETGDAET